MRRGLGTTDEIEADHLVEEMNAILEDESWWNAAKRQEAERRFAATVVSAFFDDIQAGHPNAFAIRDAMIPLPSRNDGYSRVLFVGTTGAGKTTLLRHMIASDHEVDRFPSTSTAKCTVSDIEIILSEGPYSAVVTFLSEHIVIANIEDCVADACVAAWDGKSDSEIAERLLNHRDQRFRLSYTLGTLTNESGEAAADEFSFGDDSPPDHALQDEDDTSENDRTKNSNAIRGYVDRIKTLTRDVAATVSRDLGEDINRLMGADRDAVQEFFELEISESESFFMLCQDILEDVASRFEILEANRVTRLRSGWPEFWSFATDDREAFIKAVRWFASNYAPQFGRLLTPLVDGIRVSGPLYPIFSEHRPKLVLLDGQGLGHTPESSSSVTTHITRRFSEVDVILVVDSAQQPMQAAPLSVVRSVASSGHQQKLTIAFSHFDNVKGANLPTYAAKRAHVMASVANALASLRTALPGSSVIRSMEQTIADRCYMLGGLDRRTTELPKGYQVELARLVGHFEDAIRPPPPPVAYPRYNPDGLPLAILAASQGFQRLWLGRLGLTHHEAISKDHWTRIKALSKRIAGETNVEYDSLRPLADFVDRLTEEVGNYLANPAGWEPRVPDEEEAQAALDLIRQEVHTKFHELGMHRMIQDQLGDWRRAFELKGKGSALDRARELRDIYDEAAPVPSAVISEVSATFLAEVRRIVDVAVENQRRIMTG
ncbi:MAG TPA: hypothetical protein VKI44_34765 [Acetobacteraceae bacterium]|nr:hypothetical protein [Acetobacteraceae bacterium]